MLIGTAAGATAAGIGASFTACAPLDPVLPLTAGSAVFSADFAGRAGFEIAELADFFAFDFSLPESDFSLGFGGDLELRGFVDFETAFLGGLGIPLGWRTSGPTSTDDSGV